ncbi:MAG: AtpZ/AtpI family protein [Lachnospiraceae bacterium]|nr:AtpZ/AtpI family protein [Lachnospiraceae bacterium]MBR2403977.1 AtpZ/AtpI family protein [Lachnospiraceae bacterium]MBR4058442.1 AtpZ/AtpI family protein [Lachnospiraceae bacterium]
MKKQSLVMRSLTTISQFGINMVVPIGMCSFAGYFLDKWLGTSFFIIVLFFVGALAGFRNIYILARKIYEDDSRKDNPYVSRINRDKSQ